MIVFRYGGESLRYLQSIAEHGAYPVDENDLDRLGYAHVHLSSEMSHEAANETACYISRRFMSQADYFDLKSFSYFPRGFSRRNFSDLVATIPEADLPFVPG
jgi:uncharacterized protein YifE (UPF0438 family)